MKQEAEFQKYTEEQIQKQLKEGAVDLLACLKKSTVTIEDVQDPWPPNVMFALSGEENPILSLEDAKYDKDSDSVLDDTDVDEPPPCPVDMMYLN